MFFFSPAYLSTSRNFEEHDLCYEEWKSVLRLSTRWSFSSIRKLALSSIEPPTPHDRLLLARAYSVDDWVVPALSALCERMTPLTLSEALQMNIEDVVLVSTVREHIRGRMIQVDAAEIPPRVEAEQLFALGHKTPSSSSRESGDNTPMAGEWHSRTRREKSEAEARAKAQEGTRQRVDAEAKPEEARIRAKEDAENKTKAEEEAEAKEAVDRKAHPKAAKEAKAIADAEAEAKAAEEAKVVAGAGAKATAEKAKQETAARAATGKAEVAAAEEVKKEKERRADKLKETELQRAKAAEEQVAKQRAADRARKASMLTASSPPSGPISSQSSGWLFSKVSQAVSAIVTPGQPDDPRSPSRPAATVNSDLFPRRHIKILASPNGELGPRNPSVMRHSTSNSTSQETSTSSLQTTDLAAVGPDNAVETGGPSSEGDAVAASKNGNPDPEADVKEHTALSGADDSHATGEGSTAPQGEDAKPEKPPKLTLPTVRVCQLSTTTEMSPSSVETPADEAGSSAVEVEEEGGAGEWGIPSKPNKKKKPRKMKGENSPRSSSGATVNDVDNPIEQDLKPVTSDPVDVPGGEGDGILVDKADSSSEDSAVFMDAPLAEVEVEKVADANTSGSDEWNDWADEREVLHN